MLSEKSATLSPDLKFRKRRNPYAAATDSKEEILTVKPKKKLD